MLHNTTQHNTTQHNTTQHNTPVPLLLVSNAFNSSIDAFIPRDRKDKPESCFNLIKLSMVAFWSTNKHAISSFFVLAIDKEFFTRKIILFNFSIIFLFSSKLSSNSFTFMFAFDKENSAANTLFLRFSAWWKKMI